MSLIMHMLLQMCILFFCKYSVILAIENESNNPIFNIDHTALEKKIAEVFNKVAHSSATTKRSVAAYEAQVSQSIIHSTSPSPTLSLLTTSLMSYPKLVLKATNIPQFREAPSYSPPSRALFTPPLPPEYSNPFADKPTLRGTNVDLHFNSRRPIPPPSLTPAQERIPIKPPDLVESTSKNVDKQAFRKNKIVDTILSKDTFELSDKAKDINETVEFVPSLHFTSISRILSGSNGRKQDIPEILLKPISTKAPYSHSSTVSSKEESSTSLTTKASFGNMQSATNFSINGVPGKTSISQNIFFHNYDRTFGINSSSNSIHNIEGNNDGKIKIEPQPPRSSSRVPDLNESNLQNNVPGYDVHPSESTWKVAWSLHVYLAASIFTLIALYSVYKIVRFNNTTNLLTQSYFLTINFLLTIVCMMRCFHLFYDAYNLGHSLPETLSRVLLFLPSSLIAAAFATLILYISRCSTAPSLYQNKCLTPMILILSFVIHITLCTSLYISGYVLGYTDESKILPLICQCIYIVICITLGLCYMYVYRVIRSQLNISIAKSINTHVASDYACRALNTAVTTTIATALLFILMGFVQLYGIFSVSEQFQPYPWLWWGWEFSVRLLELSMCGLLVWVAGLSQYQLREKQIQQHIIHPGFALFPCGSSASTENMDDALYPAICSTNQAIKNYAIRTGKQVYDDSFPLNTLPEHLNSGTFERQPGRMSGSLSHYQKEITNTFEQDRPSTQSFERNISKSNLNFVPRDVHMHTMATGSTMLVAEDGFVRFRNLGIDHDPPLDIHKPTKNQKRRRSLTHIDKPESIQPTTTHKIVHNFQNSLPTVNVSVHRNKHQCYTNA